VLCDLLEHVIEEADAGAMATGFPVEIDGVR
jgi:hypothetical protein